MSLLTSNEAENRSDHGNGISLPRKWHKKSYSHFKIFNGMTSSATVPSLFRHHWPRVSCWKAELCEKNVVGNAARKSRYRRVHNNADIAYANYPTKIPTNHNEALCKAQRWLVKKMLSNSLDIFFRTLQIQPKSVPPNWQNCLFLPTSCPIWLSTTIW